MALDDDDVREILRIIDESELDELRIETEGFSLHVRRGDAGEASSPAMSPALQFPGTPAPQVPPASPVEPASGAASPPEAEPRDGRLTIESPMLGTFYRAEGPGQDPFVELGSVVEPETVVCIIEVMKMMSSVTAGMAGTIAEICPANGELVEYGAPLFRVSPPE